ncbi:MAG: PRC and DUF2382 domain-containing protein [Rubrobacteraceae bacterium]
MANNEERDDRFKGVETYEGYAVNDRDGEKVGKVDDLFVDESNEPEYVGVKMGLLGMNSTLIPMDICRVDESDQTITVETEKEKAKDGPSFDDDQEISQDFERQVRDHYGLNVQGGAEDRGGYGDYYSDEDGDEREERTPGRSGDDDDLTVQRTEEELRAGTREREAGGVNVRKRVRTDKEQIKVPKKREEVSVERVQVDEGSSSPDAEIGEEDINVPVMEEEVITEKKAVVKEELRIKKDTVEEEEIVEDDVRKEEIEVDDETGRRD